MLRPMIVVLCSVTLLAAQPGPRPVASPHAPAQPRWEWKVASFGRDEAAGTMRLNELAAQGWEYAGPLAGDLVAFRRSASAAAVLADVKALQGNWSTTQTGSILRNPNVAGGGDPEHRYTLSYSGTRYALKDDSGFTIQAGTFSIIDPTSNPKQIDYVCTEGGYRGLRFRAIYTVTADEHRVCSDYGNDLRPATLDKMAGHLRITERVK